MTGLALAYLIYLGAVGVWDVLEPHNGVSDLIRGVSPFRLFAGGAMQAALVVLCLLVLAAAPVTYVIVFGTLIVLECLQAVARR